MILNQVVTVKSIYLQANKTSVGWKRKGEKEKKEKRKEKSKKEKKKRRKKKKKKNEKINNKRDCNHFQIVLSS